MEYKSKQMISNKLDYIKKVEDVLFEKLIESYQEKDSDIKYKILQEINSLQIIYSKYCV